MNLHFNIFHCLEKNQWKDASELIKTSSRKPKKVGALKDKERDSKRVAEENKRNKKKSNKNLKARPGGGRRGKFSGEDYFTFSLDGLIPAYGDPSQVRPPHHLREKFNSIFRIQLL